MRGKEEAHEHQKPLRELAVMSPGKQEEIEMAQVALAAFADIRTEVENYYAFPPKPGEVECTPPASKVGHSGAPTT